MTRYTLDLIYRCTQCGTEKKKQFVGIRPDLSLIEAMPANFAFFPVTNCFVCLACLTVKEANLASKNGVL